MPKQHRRLLTKKSYLSSQKHRPVTIPVLLKVRTPNVSASELELFAALIECEAGSTHYEGMLAVASVVMNRVNHRYYPDTITGVIYQSGQFSPVASGKLDKVLKRGVKILLRGGCKRCYRREK